MVRTTDFFIEGCIYTHVSKRFQLRRRFSCNKERNIEYRIAGNMNCWQSTGTRDLLEAGSYVENLMVNNGHKIESCIMFGDFAKDFYSRTDENSYRKYLEGFGYHYDDFYFIHRQELLDNHIMPRFGKVTINSITTYQIEMWYTNLMKINKKEPLSSETKTRVKYILSAIMDFALKKNVIDANPCDKVHSIRVENKERGYFTKKELSLLFPKDYAEFLRIWGYKEDSKDKRKTIRIALMWGLYFSIMIDTGFRPGEVSAITRNSFIGGCGVYVESSVDSRIRAVKNSIKTTNKGQKYKVGILSDYTLKLLGRYKVICKSINLFKVRNGVITTPTANKHFRLSLERAGIPINERSQYCLRHSFDTYMLNSISDNLSDKDILRLMGHTSYRKEYDHRTADDLVRSLSGAKSAIDSIRA